MPVDSIKKITRRSFIKNSMRGLILLGLGKGVYNTGSYNVELTKINIKIKNLPPSFRGLRIAHLSDLHSSLLVSEGLIARAAELVMTERPDIIFLTGDYISGSMKFLSSSIGDFNRKYLDRCVTALSKLNAPMGIYGVLGNHDMWSGNRAVDAICSDFSSKLGVTWLRNSNTELYRDGEKITLIGVDDYWEGGSLIEATRGAHTDRVRILLSHNPDINEEIYGLKERIDLVLSGHTHGGQVVLPFIGMPFLPLKSGQKYRAGLVKEAGHQTYITRGVGHFLVPLRINCPPEATVLTLI